MIEVRGLQQTQAVIVRVAGEGKLALRRVLLMASFETSKRLKLRTISQVGGVDPFWGKLSPREGALLRGRSGMTSKRITAGGVLIQRGDVLEAPVGSPDAHVAFHERGGVIPDDFPGYRMSPKGWLRIPTAAAQTPAGEDRLRGASIRSLPGVFIFKSKTIADALWAAIRKGKDLVLLYLLARRSPLRGRHRARDIFGTVRREMEPLVAMAAQREAALLAAGANHGR